MTDHIGIVACSGPGAALCYETICAEAAELMGAFEHPEVSMHAFSFARHARLIEAGDWAGIGGLMLDSVKKSHRSAPSSPSAPIILRTRRWNSSSPTPPSPEGGD